MKEGDDHKIIQFPGVEWGFDRTVDGAHLKSLTDTVRKLKVPEHTVTLDSLKHKSIKQKAVTQQLGFVIDIARWSILATKSALEKIASVETHYFSPTVNTWTLVDVLQKIVIQAHNDRLDAIISSLDTYIQKGDRHAAHIVLSDAVKQFIDVNLTESVFEKPKLLHGSVINLRFFNQFSVLQHQKVLGVLADLSQEKKLAKRRSVYAWLSSQLSRLNIIQSKSSEISDEGFVDSHLIRAIYAASMFCAMKSLASTTEDRNHDNVVPLKPKNAPFLQVGSEFIPQQTVNELIKIKYVLEVWKGLQVFEREIQHNADLTDLNNLVERFVKILDTIKKKGGAAEQHKVLINILCELKRDTQQYLGGKYKMPDDTVEDIMNQINSCLALQQNADNSSECLLGLANLCSIYGLYQATLNLVLASYFKKPYLIESDSAQK